MDELYQREYKNISRFTDTEYWINFNYLQYSITQLFIKRWTKNILTGSRSLLKMGTGTGKTLSSLLIGQNVINIRNSLHNIGIDHKPTYVIIIGFSGQVYKREFLKFTEFRFITYEEREELYQLRKSINESYGEVKELLRVQYTSLKNKIKKRITTPEDGGYYKFFGYKELVSRLFLTKLSDDIKPTEIKSLVEKGKIKVNKDILGIFKNGHIICDEIHQTYNTVDVNNYGAAIQYLLDYYGTDISATFLSATILNNHKREVVDLANLIRDPGTPHFDSEEFFHPDGAMPNKKSLDPIYEQFKGKVIFLEEETADYPELRYMGETSANSISKHIEDIYYSGFEKYRKESGFMKFTECKFAPLHQNTYEKSGLFNEDETTSNNIIHNMVVPNPDFPAQEILKFHPDHKDYKNRDLNVVGLYDPKEIREKLINAPLDWKKKIGITFQDEKDYFVLSGPWQRYENQKIYSSKKVRLFDIISKELTNDPTKKMLIYDPYVKGAGIIDIAEFLKENGFIEYGTMPNPNTFSADEFIRKAEWDKKYPDKEFRPATIFTLQYNVSDNRKNQMIDLFNDPANRYGNIIKIMVASRKVKQSIDIKDGRVEIIYSRPTNISETIQIIGRLIRNGALDRLDSSQNFVNLYIMMGVNAKKSKDYSIETRQYIKKIIEFKEIQKVEMPINKDAINNYIYEKKKFSVSDPLGALPFSITLPDSDIKIGNYFIDDHYKYVAGLMFAIIKRGFMSNPCWSYDQLWDYVVESPSMNIYVYKKTNDDKINDVYKKMFSILMKGMLYNKNKSIINFSSNIFSIDNIFVDLYYQNGKARKSIKKAVVQYGDYYVLMPIDVNKNISKTPYDFLIKESEPVYRRYIIKPKKAANIIKEFKKYINETKDKNSLYYNVLLKYSSVEHYSLLRNHIEGVYKIPSNIYKVYVDLKIAGDNWYEDYDKRNVYENKRWEVYSKKYYDFEENKLIVGVVHKDNLKLKEPSTESIIDQRKVSKGINCTNTKYATLEYYAKELGIKIDGKVKVKNLCNLVFRKLVDLEIETRIKKGKKYLYLFNEINE